MPFILLIALFVSQFAMGTFASYLPALVVKATLTVAFTIAGGLGFLMLKRKRARQERIDNSYTLPTDKAGWETVFPNLSMLENAAFEGLGAGDRLLLVGVTGGTGQQVVRGVMEAKTGAQIVVLTRNPDRPSAQQLRKAGCELVKGDLDDEASLKSACVGITAMYCHGTSVDAAAADPVEVYRAERLARAARDAGVQYIVYQSAGGADRDTGLPHMEQKYMVEELFRKSRVPCTMLRATLFMEELWKKYTRPAILKGTFQFAMPPTNKQQFVSCRDMGFAAATVLKRSKEFEGKSVELCADELQWQEVAEAFSANQQASGLPLVSYKEAGFVTECIFWLISDDLWNIIMFYRHRGYQANLKECNKLFPGLTSFKEFLKQTKWADPTKTYEDLSEAELETAATAAQ